MCDAAMRVFSGMFDAAMYCDLYRVPELFCGFDREPGEGPVLYPVACAPQAWSAASIFLLLQGSLGLSINALDRKIQFVGPALPPFLSKVRLSNLTVGSRSADLLVVRHESDISVNVLRGDEDFEVVVLPRARE
jgi:glycogen debranching enzyme